MTFVLSEETAVPSMTLSNSSSFSHELINSDVDIIHVNSFSLKVVVGSLFLREK
jgi:hypothetical protein